jgi:hypothetical protein
MSSDTTEASPVSAKRQAAGKGASGAPPPVSAVAKRRRRPISSKTRNSSSDGRIAQTHKAAASGVFRNAVISS